MEQPVTYQEFEQMKHYYENKIQLQNEIIAGLEELHVDSVNHMLSMSKEIDELTKLVWQNPNMNANETSC